MNETLKTIEREKMIETTKEAYKTYKVIRKNYPYNFEDINFSYTKYFFYMKMLTTIYQDLNRKELESKWKGEIENE